MKKEKGGTKMIKKILAIFLFLVIVGVMVFTIDYTNKKNDAIIEEQNTKDLQEKLQQSKIEDYIVDEKYTSVDILSSKVQDLYNKTKIRKEIAEVPEHYKFEKFTNDSIITLTLENKVNSLEKKVFDEILGQEVKFYEFDMHDFSEKAQNLWGKEITYNLEEYQGTFRCEKYNYDKVSQKLIQSFSSKCEVEEDIFSELVFAYETENKLVVIEKNLYVRFIENDKDKIGIYNNVKEKQLVQPLTNEEINKIKQDTEERKNILKKYEKFATYYSYTFLKKEDGTYILKDFNRLNKK